MFVIGRALSCWPLRAAFQGQWAQGVSVAVVLVEELVEVWDADAEYALERLFPVLAVDAFGVELG